MALNNAQFFTKTVDLTSLAAEAFSDLTNGRVVREFVNRLLPSHFVGVLDNTGSIDQVCFDFYTAGSDYSWDAGILWRLLKSAGPTYTIDGDAASSDAIALLTDRDDVLWESVYLIGFTERGHKMLLKVVQSTVWHKRANASVILKIDNEELS